MLELKHLVKSFGEHIAVDKVGFSLNKGEVLGFLGPNGAGKSTTMRMVAGVIEPDQGDVLISGHSIITAPREAQRRLGFLPEGAPLYPDMTPVEFLNFMATAYDLDRAERKRAIDRVIADARIANVASRRNATLSKGYRRRVGLAGALLNDPDVLVLDEPTDGLDPVQKRAVRALIARMAPEKAILISTHTLEEVPAMCNRAIIIDRGKVVADGTPESLASQSPGGLEETFITLAGTAEADAA
ncbi:ABC transporter ATP-binding protein [Henriciella mobilis]|uniref:ABC transporter ATP-binding protein n=1 Tax=Henriciella mobilis TaxID=2305467 RepID=A0A399RF29_9PROT|nr:ABC transporter ATP-binding protein [Henriciella mobilis]RIJ30176.1 ABC transporter ATP-binding protein [Henriciella mobilis]